MYESQKRHSHGQSEEARQSRVSRQDENARHQQEPVGLLEVDHRVVDDRHAVIAECTDAKEDGEPGPVDVLSAARFEHGSVRSRRGKPRRDADDAEQLYA